MSTKDFLEKDYYKALGVAKDAPADEIKKSYRKLARKYHPDANKGDAKAEERFKEISEAYDVLSDEKRRKEYDEARVAVRRRRPPDAGPAAGGGFAASTWATCSAAPARAAAGPAAGRAHRRPVRRRCSAAAAARPTQARPRRGADVETEVTLTFSDAIDGMTVPLRLTSEAACPTCRGTGAKAGTVPAGLPDLRGHRAGAAATWAVSRSPSRAASAAGRGLVVDDPCPTCRGSGRATSTRTIQARIPAGVARRAADPAQGQGRARRARRPGRRPVRRRARPAAPGVRPQRRQPDPDRAGDVPRGGARRRDQGAVARRQPVTLRIPAGTPNGRTFRVRGRGVARRDGTKGDLLVTVDVAGAAEARPTGPGRRWRRSRGGAQRRRPAAADLLRLADGRSRPAMDPVRRRHAGLRHLGGGPAGRAAPADAAQVRPARPGLARPRRRAAAAATRCATSCCCARSSGCPRRRASTSPASSGSRARARGRARCASEVARLPRSRGAEQRAGVHPRRRRPARASEEPPAGVEDRRAEAGADQARPASSLWRSTGAGGHGMDYKLTHEEPGGAVGRGPQRPRPRATPQVEPAHLLVALLEQTDGTAGPLLQAVGADPLALRRRAEEQLAAAAEGAAASTRRRAAARPRPARGR